MSNFKRKGELTGRMELRKKKQRPAGGNSYALGKLSRLSSEESCNNWWSAEGGRAEEALIAWNSRFSGETARRETPLSNGRREALRRTNAANSFIEGGTTTKSDQEGRGRRGVRVPPLGLRGEPASASDQSNGSGRSRKRDKRPSC